jgi:hypothetical protein
MPTTPTLPQPFSISPIPGTDCFQVAVGAREVAKISAADDRWEVLTRHASRWDRDPVDALRCCLSIELRRVGPLLAGAAALGSRPPPSRVLRKSPATGGLQIVPL